MSFLQSINAKIDGLIDRAAVYIAGYKETPPPNKFRYEKVEVRGNPNMGEVVHMRQMHTAKDQNGSTGLIVGMCQCLILDELEAGKFKHVFVEGFDKDMEPGDPVRTGKNCWAEVVKKNFPEGIPREPSIRQLATLALVGAPCVYAYFHPDVTLHRTEYPNETQNQQMDIMKEALEAYLDPENAENASFDRKGIFLKWMAAREVSATREVMAYLKKNPGAKVALVYGSRHQFKDDFGKEKTPPVVVSIAFPYIANTYNRSTAYAQARKQPKG